MKHTGDTVAHDMFALLRQAAAPVVTRWSYSSDDPYAVTVAIQGRSRRWVEWIMARDLLVAGLSGPIGIGDVRVRPERTHDWDVVLIEICSPDGQAVLEVDHDLVQHFVDATMEAVPLGGETEAIDMDAEIEKLTRSCAE